MHKSMATPKNPVSMQDIALAAGVHQTTVSRALRNDHRLPSATRERIRKIAEEAGYRPHPLVSALIALRRARHPPRFSATIAFVVHHELGTVGEHHLAGARAMAEQLGYKLDVFVLGPTDLSESRLNAVLRARNIHGILIAPLPEAHGHFTLDWERFCVVVLEYTFTTPVFDRIVHDSYGGMRRIMSECRQRGIRRLGLTLTTIGHERTEQLNGAAYWIEQKTGGFTAIPPLIRPDWDTPAFDAWFRRYRPEAVVTSNALLHEVQTWCIDHQLCAGDDIQLINVNAMPAENVSGIVQDHRAIGATAARMVIEKISSNDRAVPLHPQTTHIPGVWLEGATLRPKASLQDHRG